MGRAPTGLELAGIAMVSGAAIATQIALTRVLSITLWHHFAYLVVGVALLGFGVAGAWLATRRESTAVDADALPRRAQLAALASLAAILTSLVIRPNALELFRNASVALALSLIVALTMIPFAGAGLVIGSALQTWPRDAGKIYAADLAGGGAAAALAVLGLSSAGALGVLVLAILTTAAAAVLLSRSAKRRRSSVLAALLLALLALATLQDEDDWIVPAPTKELALIHQPGRGVDRIEHRAWTADGRIDVTHAFDGPPLAAGDIVPPAVRPYRVRFVTQDGSAPTTMHRVEHDPSELSFLPHSTTAAVWVLRGARFGADTTPNGPRVLVIGVGGGVDVMMALAHGAAHVDGVEVNPAIVALHTETFADFTHLADDQRVTLRHDEGRSFVDGSTERWDVVQLAGVDTFTALAAGAYSLAEAHVYTAEAFEAYLRHLRPGGCLSVSRLILNPPRETLRLAITARAALQRIESDGSPERHLAVVRGARWATLLACDRPIDDEALARLRSWATAHGFSLAYDPREPDAGSAPFAAALQSDDAARTSFVADYPYRVEPAVDEAPFFFDYFRWSSLLHLREMKSGSVYASPVPISHGVQLLTLLITTLLAAFGILRPLRNRDLPRAERRSVAVYFACLGVGYLFVEVALIQRLTFFLGHPTSALAVVLSALLASSGAGAAASRALVDRFGVRPLALALPLLLLSLAAVSHWLLPRLLGLPFGTRLGVSLLVVAVAGFPLGIPFPHGIRLLGSERAQLVAWAFGVNAFLTVIAAAAAPIAAGELGFSTLLVAAALAYVAAFRALRRLASEEMATR